MPHSFDSLSCIEKCVLEGVPERSVIGCVKDTYPELIGYGKPPEQSAADHSVDYMSGF
jgi:hypothetical protein